MRNKYQKYTTESFIEKANIIHNNFYDYSKVIYTNIKNKVKIICPIHGEFEQLADSHLIGKKCKKCSKVYTYTNKEFIEKCNIIHNFKYDYNLTNHKKNNSKIKIICPEHGEF